MNNFHVTRTGILFVISAPSGAGKTTLIQALRKKKDFIYSVSCTTRLPRPGEVHGEHYFFMSDDEFRHHIAAGDFLEHAEVHGRFYGTLKSNVIAHLNEGTDVLLDVDTVGAASIRSCNDPIIQAALADVFIMPPGLDEISRRLSQRGTESEEQLATRVRNAAAEMEKWREYRYTLVSGSREEDVEKFRGIMAAERSLTRRLTLSPV